ncbi:MAG: hypothetical protein II868_04380 [Butyrivibrio sp.]|nr:hypothetical protein [Butyrivibrio sp.]
MNEKKPLLVRILTQNTALKIVSILSAAVAWFLVSNFNDEVISRSFYNVPVTMRNTAVLTDAGQVYEVLDNTDNIASVTITAQRSVVETFTRDNIQAVADMNDLTSRNTIPIRLSVNKNANDVVSVDGSIEDVRLNVEDRKTRTISLTVRTPGELTEGYMVGRVTPAQNLVRVSGPVSRVDAVATAIAEVDVTGFTSQIGTDADIRLYDADGVLIRDTAISQNITTVRVQIEILESKEVPVRVRLTGTPADGYVTVGGAAVNPATVAVAGETEAVAAVSEIAVTGDELNITGRTEDLQLNVDLRRFLPSGIVFADSEYNGAATVTLNIEQAVLKQAAVPLTQLVLENQPEDAPYMPDSEEAVLVTLSGAQTETDRVNAGDITLVVDVAEAIAASGTDRPARMIAQARVQVAGDIQVTGSATVTLVRE